MRSRVRRLTATVLRVGVAWTSAHGGEWLAVGKNDPYKPFICFCLMISAAASLSRCIWDPET